MNGTICAIVRVWDIVIETLWELTLVKAAFFDNPPLRLLLLITATSRIFSSRKPAAVARDEVLALPEEPCAVHPFGLLHHANFVATTSLKGDMSIYVWWGSRMGVLQRY
ncbi:hypothetical protein [Streptomyces sp. NPDC052036]|uniref:hypothetical protein n=1 Tax=Streptomyces sp. NPDC052036 TaxID=3155171 RepID=UPI00342C4FFA